MARKMDLILHPVRMQVVQTLAGGRNMTAQELGAVLKDVPQASLYRNIRRLFENGVIEVVRETPVRGAVEKVYALSEAYFTAAEAESKDAGPEEMERYCSFVMYAMMDKVKSYVYSEGADYYADGFSCRMGKYFMTDAEYQEFLADLAHTFGKVVANAPDEGRKPRDIALMMIPEKKN